MATTPRKKAAPPENTAAPTTTPAATATPAPDKKKANKFVPLWQKITGIHPATELEMPYEIRWPALKALLNEFYKRLRCELADIARDRPPTDPNAKPVPIPGNNIDDGIEVKPLDDFFAITRTFQWDPLLKVCHELGIARSRLSRYCKEIKGIAAHEVMDALKAEKVLPQLRMDMKAFCLKTYAGFRTDFPKVNHVYQEDETRWMLWKELKFHRRIPDFKTTWAIRLGFPSYARLHKACLICYGKTPHQLEMEILLKIALRYDEDFKAHIKAHPESLLVNGRATQELMCYLYENHKAAGGNADNFGVLWKDQPDVDAHPESLVI